MVWERCPGQTGCQSHGQEAEHGEMLSCVVRLWGEVMELGEFLPFKEQSFVFNTVSLFSKCVYIKLNKCGAMGLN